MVTRTCNGTSPVPAVAWQSRSRMNPESIDAAERVIQQWLLAHQGQIRHGRQQAWRSCKIRHRLLARRGQGQATPTVNGGKAADVGPYLAISRESGTGGGQIARLVSEMTGWAVLDRDLLECLAELYRTSPAVLKLVDDATANRISEIFANGICPDFTAQTEYMFHLSRVVLMAAQAGKVIYVGRGAHFLLPQRRGLIVRLVASPRYRVQQIVERRRLSFDKARDYIEKTDAGRQEFVRQYFHRGVADPHLYDLMVNVERIGPHRTAQLIADALGSCFDSRPSS
jgi:hypothetical protein